MYFLFTKLTIKHTKASHMFTERSDLVVRQIVDIIKQASHQMMIMGLFVVLALTWGLDEALKCYQCEVDQQDRVRACLMECFAGI